VKKYTASTRVPKIGSETVAIDVSKVNVRLEKVETDRQGNKIE
jgi:hypothetical protein